MQKLFTHLIVLLSCSSAFSAPCKLNVVIGEYVGSKGRLSASFKSEKVCFRIKNKVYTEKTPIAVFQKDLFCDSPEAKVKDGKFIGLSLMCAGLEINYTESNNKVRIHEVKIKPLEESEDQDL